MLQPVPTLCERLFCLISRGSPLEGLPIVFVSFDCHEPKHVHVQPERRVCKYWMEPVVLAGNHGFSPVELNTIGQLLRDNRNQILEAWDEHCGTRR